MWPSSAVTRQVNYSLPPEFFLLAPASSFHHPDATTSTPTTINFDPHAVESVAPTIGVGMIPLLSAPHCFASSNNADEEVLTTARNVNIGVNPSQGQSFSTSLKKPIILDDESNVVQRRDMKFSSLGSITCQDCGNQAKKDCSHQRCRTCCKSRGYHCSTHVKSTWVPAERRRERLLKAAAEAGSSQSTSSSKKPRLADTSQAATTASHNSTSNNTPPRSFETSSKHQDSSFKEALPGQVRAPAVFKCVRVSALDHDGENEYAYQAMVKIGGHVFKGFLYDQGVQGKEGFPSMSDLHLGGGGIRGSDSGSGRNGTATSSRVLDPSDVYAASRSRLLVGSNYGIPIN